MVHCGLGVPALEDIRVIRVSVSGIGFDPGSKGPVVLLKEEDGSRILPVWIGECEAIAIHIGLNGTEFQRPLTHDLLKNVITGLGYRVKSVIIDKVEGGVFYARIVLYQGDEVIEVDARPSDALALAVRVGCTVFVEEEVMDMSSIALEDGMDPDALREYLKGIDPEDFGKFTL